MNKNNNDNIIRRKKKKTSKGGGIVKSIFFVNYKILTYIINVLLTIILVAIITAGICIAALFYYVNVHVDNEVPSLDMVSIESDLTTTLFYYVYDCRFERTNGRAVPFATLHGIENRTWVRYHETPRHLRYAFIALEDHRFREHNGVDWLRTASAVRQYLLPAEGARMFGGSTITQQLVKLLTGEDDVTVSRKIQEIMRALTLEERYSKEQILETYMNTVFLANGLYGVQAAANFYFGKDVSELTVLESVAIASIVQGPSAMNPLRAPDPGREHNRNFDRRNAGLRIMLEEGWITQAEFDEAYRQELVLHRGERTIDEIIHSCFVNRVIVEAQDALMEKYGVTRAMASRMVHSGGFNIYTTKDPFIQGVIDEVYIHRHEEFFPNQPEGAIPFQSAMVIMDQRNGDILGVAGGRGQPTVARAFNRATDARRQPGSAIKPVSVYGPAIEFGLMNWGTPLDDSPFMLINDRLWPANLPLGNDGFISPVAAMAISKNTTAVRMLDRLTPEVSFDFMYNTLHTRSLTEREVRPDGRVLSDVNIAPLALGGLTHGITPLELTAAFTPFAANGIFSRPRSFIRIENQRGDIVIDNGRNRSIATSPETAFIMTRLMEQVMWHPGGTGRHLRMLTEVPGIPVSGKTGTTNDQKDRWFIAYTPYFLGGVWFGYDQPSTMNVPALAGNPPMRLWSYVMEEVHRELLERDEELRGFNQPGTVIRSYYCMDSGMIPGPNCRLDPRGANRVREGYFSINDPLLRLCDVHVVVDWCTHTRRVAGPGCPRGGIRQIALVREDYRAFPRQVRLPDAGITWRDVPDDYIFPRNSNVPFFINLVPSGIFVGEASRHFYNGFCVAHNHAMTLPPSQRPDVIRPQPDPPRQQTPPTQQPVDPEQPREESYDSGEQQQPYEDGYDSGGEATQSEQPDANGPVDPVIEDPPSVDDDPPPIVEDPPSVDDDPPPAEEPPEIPYTPYVPADPGGDTGGSTEEVPDWTPPWWYDLLD